MIFDILGWVGMVLVLVAYILLSTNKIKNGKLYQTLNLLASTLISIGLLPKNAWFSFALQVALGLIAAFTLARFLLQKKRTKQSPKNDVRE